jgi:iron(III) transport system ATP-binding protein
MTQVILRDLHKHFPGRAPGAVVHRRGAINGLDLEIPSGAFFVLLGPSGCGKTTTLRTIAGLEEPTQGSVLIGDEVVADAARGIFIPPNARNLGMMFQSYALWPHMTVAQNVAYPLERRRGQLTGAAIAARVGETLDLVGLGGLEHRFPPQLSGGQQQRVALARALVAKPRLLLFDEPLSNLDAQLRFRLRHELRRIHDEAGSTSFYVTHDQAEAFALADRIAVLKQGRVEQLGPPTDIFLSPASRFVAEFVGYENLLPGAGEGQAVFRPEGWLRSLEGRVVAPGVPAAFAAIRASALQAAFEPSPDALNPVHGVLQAVTYLGDRYSARVAVAGSILFATLPVDRWTPGRPAAGETVHLSVKPSDVVIVPADAVEPALEPSGPAVRVRAA